MREFILSVEQIDRIAQSISEGVSLSTLCDRFSVKPPTLRNSMRRAGYGELLDKALARRMITPEVLAIAEERIAAGSSVAEAARYVGFTPQAIDWRIRKKKGIAKSKDKKPRVDSELYRRPDLVESIKLNAKYLGLSLRPQA